MPNILSKIKGRRISWRIIRKECWRNSWKNNKGWLKRAKTQLSAILKLSKTTVRRTAENTTFQWLRAPIQSIWYQLNSSSNKLLSYLCWEKVPSSLRSQNISKFDSSKTQMNFRFCKILHLRNMKNISKESIIYIRPMRVWRRCIVILLERWRMDS